MVIGEGFINHQEHDAGEEGQGQDDQNRHLRAGQTPVSVCARAIKQGCECVVYISGAGLVLDSEKDGVSAPVCVIVCV